MDAVTSWLENSPFIGLALGFDFLTAAAFLVAAPDTSCSVALNH